MKDILLITVDSLRADYVFGPKAPDSLETLPKLADDGIHFTNAHSNAGYTKASFLSILSGTYPWMFDAVDEGFDPDRPHVAELLSDVGYETAGFHTNAYLSPTYNYDRGFDQYLGRENASSDAGMGHFESTFNDLVETAVSTRGVAEVVHWVYSQAGKRVGLQLGSNLYRPAEELNDTIVEWTRGSSGPRFVWAHYMDVHNPYYPHEGTVSEGLSRRKAIKLFHRVNEQRGDAPQTDIDTLERLYRGEIEYFDRELGDFLERLDDTIGLDDTLVVFSSDHGEAFNERGVVFHPGSALYEENVHIPIIVRDPEIGHSTVETPVSNVDLVPTLLSAADIDGPEELVGRDLTTLHSHPPDDRFVFAEAYSQEDGYAMVTDGKYRLLRDMAAGEDTLYSRFESTRSNGEAPEKVREELSAALDEHIDSVEQFDGQGGDVEVTEDVRLQLRKLGYDE